MASAHLSRTFTSGNRKTYTFSFWFKVSNPSIGSGNYQALTAASGGDHGFWLQDNKVDCYMGSQFRSKLQLRDTNGWYHMVAAVDTTQATDTNRFKCWINNVQITEWDDGGSGTPSYPAQNYDTLFNLASGTHTVGRRASTNTHHWDGEMAHFHYVDGTAYTPSTFGETDATTGIWKPKTAPTVTYGTNGFFLKFDNSANMGLDSAGSNNLTTTGTIIQNKDTPSNVFATLNPLLVPTSNGPTFSNANTTSITNNSTGSYKWGGCTTLGMTSGKYYCEAKATVDNTYSRNVIGITGDSANLARTNGSILNATHSWGYYSSNGAVAGNGGGDLSGYNTTYTTGDIISMALDLDNNKLYFRKNNDAWQNSGNPTSGASGTGAVSIIAASATNDGAYFFAQTDDTGTSSPSKFDFNFGNGYFGTTAVASAENPDDGNGIFEYDVPAGYRALCTKSLNAEEYS